MKEKFVRKHVTEEESKDFLEKVGASNSTSMCMAEDVALKKFKRLDKKIKTTTIE